MHEDLIDILKARYIKQETIDIILSEVDHYGYGCDITIKHGDEDHVERMFDVRRSEIIIYVERLPEHNEINMFMSLGTYVIVAAYFLKKTKIIGTCEISGKAYAGPGAVLINTSLTGNSCVENCTVKNSVISGESRIRETDVTASIIENCRLVESDEVICKILTGVTLENNKKLKRELV